MSNKALLAEMRLWIKEHPNQKPSDELTTKWIRRYSGRGYYLQGLFFKMAAEQRAERLDVDRL